MQDVEFSAVRAPEASSAGAVQWKLVRFSPWQRAAVCAALLAIAVPLIPLLAVTGDAYNRMVGLYDVVVRPPARLPQT